MLAMVIGITSPHSISTPQAVRWYVNAFLVSFNQANLTEGEQHALRVCCLLAIPPPPPGIGDVTLDISSNLSQVRLTAITRIVEDLASGMGRLSPNIEANRAVISRTLIPYLEKIMKHPSCTTCLRPRQMCECLVPASYDQLRTSPPAFTTLTSMAPHQVNLSGWRPSHNGNALIWIFRSYNVALHRGHLYCHRMDFARTASFRPLQHQECRGRFTGPTMGGVPPSSMGDMPPLRQTHPTHTITTASPAGYPLHPSCGCAL